MNITDADEEDLESAMASASDQREEELQVCEYTNINSYETNLIFLKLLGILVIHCWYAN